jgi:hypothetical protein
VPADKVKTWTDVDIDNLGRVVEKRGSKSSAAKALEDIADVPGVKKVVNDAAGQVKAGTSANKQAYLGRVFQIEEASKVKKAGNHLVGVDASYTLKNPITIKKGNKIKKNC